MQINKGVGSHSDQYLRVNPAVSNTVVALPQHFKMVFNMYVIDEYSHKEIAQELGISEKTSTTRLFRARKLIQNELAVIMKKRMVVYE